MTKKISTLVLTMVGLLTLLPIVMLLWQSIQTFDENFMPVLGIKQYTETIANPWYWNNYKNSLILTIGSLVFAMPIGILAGMLIAFSRRKSQKRLMVLYFIALMMPFQVIMLPLFQLAVQAKLHDTHASIILLNTFAPLSALVCWALIRQIDDEQWDAVLLETNSSFVIITKIILPQIAPGLMALALLLWSEAWNMVEQPLILLPSKELQPLSIYYNDILSNASGYAGAVLYALPVIVIYAIFAVYLRTQSALKHKKEDVRL